VPDDAPVGSQAKAVSCEQAPAGAGTRALSLGVRLPAAPWGCGRGGAIRNLDMGAGGPVNRPLPP